MDKNVTKESSNSAMLLADENQLSILCELLLAVMKFCQNAGHWKSMPKHKKLQFLERALSEFSIDGTDKGAELEQIADVMRSSSGQSGDAKKKLKRRIIRFGKPPQKKTKTKKNKSIKRIAEMSVTGSHRTDRKSLMPLKKARTKSRKNNNKL